jgi:uncharacterized protein YndB with AHSA1/START domain
MPETHDADRPSTAGRQVTRSVDLDAEVDDVWQAVSDPAERALWLDDDDALARHVRVDESRPGERLVWTWWRPGDEGGASTVSVVLRPVDGGTRVVVTESAPTVAPGPALRARASAGGAVGHRSWWGRCARDRWDGRLLGLELRFVAARAGVA